MTRWVVYWLAPPPTRRYVAAALLLVAAVVWDLRPEPTERHPFVGSDAVAGTPLAEVGIDWRPVPRGLLPEVDPVGVLAADVAEGEPLSPSMVSPAAVPADWWVIEVSVPEGARVGAPVRLAITTPGTPEQRLVEGVVVRGSATGIGAAPGAVAVPESASGAVATAARANQLVVLVGG